MAAIVAALPACAWAQDEEAPPSAPAGSWAFGLGVQSDNREKAKSESGGDASVWGLAEWASADGGFYVGFGFETVEAQGRDVELAVAVGWRPQVMGFDLDLSAEYQRLVDPEPGADEDAWEFTADAIRSIGPVEGRLRVQHVPDGDGPTAAGTWYEAQVAWDQSPRLSWSGAVGMREQELGPDYTGWNLGATWRLTERLELDGRWHDTDVDVAPFPGDDDYDGRFVVGLSAYF